MHTLAQSITEATTNYDIILIQEPWWNGTITTAFQGWQVILPKSNIKDFERPRVCAYYRLQAGIDITLRADIKSDLDFMILDVKREGTNHRPTRLINIYNQTENRETPNPTYTTDRLSTTQLHHKIPTIITGDWNIHHPLWNSSIHTGDITARAQETVDWLQGQGFALLNEKDAITRTGFSNQCDTILDLTFANEAACGQGLVQNHTVNADLAPLSDHLALTFTIGDTRGTVDNLSEAKFNWKDANEDEFIEALTQALHADEDQYERKIRRILNPNRSYASPEELDEAVRYINQSMDTAAEKTVPRRRMCPRSKPWWNKELTDTFRALRTMKESAKSYFQHFNRQSPLMIEEVKQLHKKALRLVKTAKRAYYQKITEEATPHNMWNIRKWTTTRRTYTSPPLQRGEDTEPAVTHADKCHTLRATLFPPQPALADEPIIDLNPREDNMIFQEVTKREVYHALFSAAQMNAPGITGMTGKAYRWTWQANHEEIYHLIRLCAKTGYHPMEWRTSVAIALQKPNRDYSLPRSYRLIQLLEVLGKVLEHIQARRLAYIAAKHDLFPTSQYGGIPGRSAEDALLCTVHDIEAAWNHKRKATLLTFDIKGFFDTIPHGHLINTLRNLHIPLPIVQWVHSFLKNRRTAICLDGKRDELRPIEIGVPQGSCVSPILAAYFTAPLAAEVAQKANSRIANTPQLSTLIQKGMATLSPTSIYVDDGSILTSGPSLDVTSKMAVITLEETHDWLAQRGMKMDEDKSDLMHFTKSKNRKDSPSVHIPTNTPNRRKEITPSKSLRYLGLWFDPQLKFHEHARKAAAKAARATEALRMLGSSIRGLHQYHLRQIYLGAILPIATYGSVAFWDGKSSTVKNILGRMQNKALRFITGAFKTTPINAMETEASIPPIDIVLNYHVEQFAIRTQKLAPSHPVTCRIPEQHRPDITCTTRPPLPYFPPAPPSRVSEHVIRKHTEKARKTSHTRITNMANLIVENSERIDPLAEAPWRRSELDHDLQERFRIFIPPNNPGTTVKQEWADHHTELVNEFSTDPEHLLIYTDGSLSTNGGIRKTGYGVVAYRYGNEISATNGAMGEH